MLPVICAEERADDEFGRSHVGLSVRSDRSPTLVRRTHLDGGPRCPSPIDEELSTKPFVRDVSEWAEVEDRKIWRSLTIVKNHHVPPKRERQPLNLGQKHLRLRTSIDLDAGEAHDKRRWAR
jgi:hypothetical protein